MAVVLIVDDHRAITAGLEFMVGELGHDTLVAHNGESALTIVCTHSVDLMVLDYHMPGGMSGLDVLREIRSGTTCPGLPVIMFSSDENVRHEAAGLGLAGFVLKTRHETLPDLITAQIGRPAE